MVAEAARLPEAAEQAQLSFCDFFLGKTALKKKKSAAGRT